MTATDIAARAFQSALDFVPLPSMRIAMPSLNMEPLLVQSDLVADQKMDELLETYQQDLQHLMRHAQKEH